MPELPSLVIVGAGGLGRGVAALVEAHNSTSPSWNLTGFVDDDASLHNQSVMGYPVRGNVEWLSQRENLFFSIAIGDGDARQHIAGQLSQSTTQPACLLHPSTSPHRTSEIKSGTIVRKGVATAVDCRIGTHTVVNMNCTVGHDSTLGAFVTLHPGVHISGSVHLEKEVTVGSGSVVLPNTRIGSRATIGASAVVTDDLPPDCTAVGRPARPQ